MVNGSMYPIRSDKTERDRFNIKDTRACSKCQSMAWHSESAFSAYHGDTANMQPLEIYDDFSFYRNFERVTSWGILSCDEAHFAAYSASDIRSLSGRVTSTG